MLNLRPYKSSDYKYIINWISSTRECAKWSADKFKYPITKETLEKYKNKCDKGDDLWIFVAVNENNIPIGHLLFNRVNYHEESAHLSFVIINPKFRGRGFGKEMMRLAIKYCFEVCSFSKLTLCVFDNNPSAHACYKSVGFKDDKHLDNAFIFRGEEWGIYEMSITK